MFIKKVVQIIEIFYLSKKIFSLKIPKVKIISKSIME